jgi:hypothetical protein
MPGHYKTLLGMIVSPSGGEHKASEEPRLEAGYNMPVACAD